MADIYLRGGAASPNDITLRDPSTPDTITGTAALTLGALALAAAGAPVVVGAAARTLGGLGLTARGTVNGEVIVETVAEGGGQHYPYAPLFDRALLARINRRREEELSVAAAFVPA